MINDFGWVDLLNRTFFAEKETILKTIQFLWNQTHGTRADIQLDLCEQHSHSFVVWLSSQINCLPDTHTQIHTVQSIYECNECAAFNRMIYLLVFIQTMIICSSSRFWDWIMMWIWLTTVLGGFHSFITIITNIQWKIDITGCKNCFVTTQY